MIVEKHPNRNEYFTYISRTQALELIAMLSAMLISSSGGSRTVRPSRAFGELYPLVNVIVITDAQYEEYRDAT